MTIISIIGVISLLFLSYMIYRSDVTNPTITNFIMSKDFFDTLREFILVILAATIAMNFSNIQDKKITKEKMITLLELSKSEIDSSYTQNQYFIDEYDKHKVEIGFLKYNSSCNVNTLSSILSNDLVITNLSSLSYSVFCNNIANANYFYTTIQNADNTDDNIYIYVKSINTHLKIISFQIENEINFLKRKISEKELKSQYEKIFNSTYTKIDSN